MILREYIRFILNEVIEKDVLSKLNALTQTNDVIPDFLKPPMKIVHMTLSDIAKAAGIDRKLLQKTLGRARLPLENVDPTTLATLQGFVTKSGIERALNKTHQNKQDVPTIVKTIDGDLIIVDGNHRVAAAILKGNNKIVVRVVDINNLR